MRFVLLPAPPRGHPVYVAIDKIEAVLPDIDNYRVCYVVMDSGQRYGAGCTDDDMIKRIAEAAAPPPPEPLKK